MSALGPKQELFARLLPRLIDKAHELGYAVRLKELQRGKQQAEWNAKHCRICGDSRKGHATQADHIFKPIGIENSLHCDGLAIDLVLFKQGAPIWDTEVYRKLGEYWESLDELAYWGGATAKVGDRLSHDGGHFSITDGGRQ